MLAFVLFDNFREFLVSLQAYHWWQVAIELLLIGSCVWGVLRYLQGTRGARLLRGIALLLIALFLIVKLLGSILDVGRIETLFTTLLGGVWFAMAVAFQPELRRALMRLGETSWFKGKSLEAAEEIEELLKVADFCSRRKIGALIAIERDTGLGGMAENGTNLDADISAELLNTIFFPNSPLHDLGVVISQNRVAFAGVQFPLAESDELEKELGSRHRAAVGLSQETDAVILIVSEETGCISIAERGTLYRKFTLGGLRIALDELLTYGRPMSKDILDRAASGATIIRPPTVVENMKEAE